MRLSVSFLAGGFDCVEGCGICTTCENDDFDWMEGVEVLTEFMWVFLFNALRFPLYFKLWYFLSFFWIYIYTVFPGINAPPRMNAPLE